MINPQNPFPWSMSFLHDTVLGLQFVCRMGALNPAFQSLLGNALSQLITRTLPLPVGSWITTSKHQSPLANGSQAGAPRVPWARPLMPAILITLTITDPSMMLIGSRGAARCAPEPVAKSAVKPPFSLKAPKRAARGDQRSRGTGEPSPRALPLQPRWRGARGAPIWRRIAAEPPGLSGD
jgi:hypothetical protein